MQLSFSFPKIKGLTKRIIMALLVAAATVSPAVFADDQPQTVGDTDIRPFTMGGRIGFQSEAYAVQGIDARRPPGMGQLNVATTFSLFGLRSGLNILYSTDDNRLRQSMNQINFYGSWRWLTVSAGTVAPRFSKYSLNGATVTGGMIEIAPRWFSVTAAGGRSQRAVSFSPEQAFREPAFERWLYAGRIGFGTKGENEFAIGGLYARDVQGSLEDPQELLPAENINLTPELRLSLFSDRFQLESSVTVSAFTRDTNTDQIDLGDAEIPGFLENTFTPHTSTFVDYAGEISARLNLGIFRMDGGYERVQPGFRSMGLAQIRSDQELIRMRTQLRLFSGRLNFTGNLSQGRNNLLNTRLSTMNRQQLGTNIMLRLGSTSSLMMSYMHMSNEINPADHSPNADLPELRQRQLSQNFMVSPSFVIMVDNFSHNISLTTAYQVMKDQSGIYEDPDQTPPGFTTFTTGLSYGISFPSSLSLNATGNYMINNSAFSNASGQGVNVSTGYSFFDRKLNTSVSLGWSRNGSEFTRILEEDEPGSIGAALERMRQKTDGDNDFLEGEYVVRQWSQQYTINLSATYRLPNGNPLRLTMRGLTSNPAYEGGREFNEFHAVLRYEHRF